MPKKKSAKKYVFLLKGVNTEKIDRRYCITLLSNITEEEPIPKNTTKIDDLITYKRTPEVISFIDETKQVVKCTVSMVNFESGKEYNNSNYYNCFWCRHSIPDNVKVLGCPVKYVPSQVVKSYHSEITKDKYTIKETITRKHMEHLEKINDDRLKLIKKDYYLTDGAFCSFNCIMAFIEEPDNKKKPLYRDAKVLLLKMYNEINKDNIDSVGEIIAAPHWRKLQVYTGNLTITQFRENFNTVEYINHGMITKLPECKSIAIAFEEKLKF